MLANDNHFIDTISKNYKKAKLDIQDSKGPFL